MGKYPVMMQRDTNTSNAQQCQQNRNPTFEASCPFLVFIFLICFRWRWKFWCVLWLICWLFIPWPLGKVNVGINFGTTHYNNIFSSCFSQYLLIEFGIHSQIYQTSINIPGGFVYQLLFLLGWCLKAYLKCRIPKMKYFWFMKFTLQSRNEIMFGWHWT